MASDRKKVKISDLVWDNLYREWLRSGMEIPPFLRSRGHNPNSAIARQKTKNWVLDVSIDNDKIDHEMEKANHIVDAMPARKEKTITEIWQMVQGWRHNQAESDYKLADNIRLHCKIILKNSIVKTIDNGQERFDTSLKPSELLSISKIAETIQRIQRLAVGLSTENVGIDHNVEIENNSVPIFEVQMGKNGKFVQIR